MTHFILTKQLLPKLITLAKLLLVVPLREDAKGVWWQKKPYFDPSLCMLVYKNTMHLNSHGEHYRSMVNGFLVCVRCWHFQRHEAQNCPMHVFGLSLTQIMEQHTKEVRILALANGTMTRNTFLLPSNVGNICRKRAEELWMKDPSDPISVHM